MTNETAAAKINGFSEGQKGYFNADCDNKIYDTKLDFNVGISEIQEAKDVAAHVNSKTQAQVDSDISPSLNNENKLSGRPC